MDAATFWSKRRNRYQRAMHRPIPRNDSVLIPTNEQNSEKIFRCEAV
jgi:hypothetical protein